MQKTKIDWCDSTVNPVVGCPRGCEYCYARKLNMRFKWVENWNKPQVFPERLKAFEEKTPKSIFVNSMSDIAYWRKDQIAKLLTAIEKNQQHRYIALTKDYATYAAKIEELTETRGWCIDESVFFVGQTVTKEPSLDLLGGADFVNIEPILDRISVDEWYFDTNYLADIPAANKAIIVGAETGNRKGKVIPQKEWIDEIVEYADENKIPIFMKESLRQLMGDDFRQDKLPWDIERSAE